MKPKCELSNSNGNIFSLLSKVREAMYNNNLRDDFDKLTSDVYKCKSYEDAIGVIAEYVEII